MKIGVLIPQSKSYVTIGKEFINGLKLANTSEASTFIIEGIGIGGDPQVTLDKMEKLSFQEDVDVIVGLVGDYDLRMLYEKANGLQIPSVFVRMGAFPHIEYPENQYAFSISYGICDSMTFLGKWLVNEGYASIAISGSYNDVGYGFVSSLEKSLYAAGGEFVGHYTPPINPRPDEAELMQSFYTALEYDAMVQLYNGVYAKENVEYLETFGFKVEKPMVFTPFGLDRELLTRAAAVANDIRVIASWLPESMTGEPSAFGREYQEKYGMAASVPSMLGYEAMLAIETAVPNRMKVLAGEEVQLNGPRGNASWTDALILDIEFNVWKAEESEGKVMMKKQTSSDEAVENIRPFEGQESGWHNAYLCY